MVSRRRGLRSKNYVEDENEQVHQQCPKCQKLFFVENFTEHDQLENEQGINYQRRGKNYDENEIPDDYCQCGKHATKSELLKRVNELIEINKFYLIVLAVLVSSFFILGTYKYWSTKRDILVEVRIKNQTQDEIDFDSELYGLEDTYKHQEERVWFTFAAGIKSVIAEKPNKPSVFLLIYDDDEAENTVKCLAQDVVRVASKYLMKKEIKPLIHAGRELNKEPILSDPGQLLVLYKDSVERRGAMIVTNLEEVKPQVATSFHFFCDRYSPLVEKAIYFFTLHLKEVPKVPKLQKVAEDALHNLWNRDLPDNKLHPLITRITGNVLKISNDYSNCFM